MVGMPRFSDEYSGHDVGCRGGDSFWETYVGQVEPMAVNGEKAEEDAKREKFAAMADALAWVLRYCWSQAGQQEGTRTPRDAFKRFVALSMTVRPDLFGNMTFAAMARRLRLSKATLSKLSLDFSDRAGLHFRRNRRETARKKFSAVQKRIWAKRRNGAT